MEAVSGSPEASAARALRTCERARVRTPLLLARCFSFWRIRFFADLVFANCQSNLYARHDPACHFSVVTRECLDMMIGPQYFTGQSAET